MENVKELNVPYIVYESAMTRSERHTKRVVIALIMTILLLFISNGLWLYAWMQYDYVSYEQDGAGINNVNLGEQGNVLNEPNSTGAPEASAQE